MSLYDDLVLSLPDVRTERDLKSLFVSRLNYEFADDPVRTDDLPTSLQSSVGQCRVISSHGDFAVVHCQLRNPLLPMGLERRVAEKLSRRFPYALFVFSSPDSDEPLWHFVNLKVEAAPATTLPRSTMRRIAIGPDQKLHTAAQRIERIAIPAEGLSALDLQHLHDQAFDVEAVTKEFFKAFRAAFAAVADDIAKRNGLSQQAAQQEAETLLDRLMFLYFIQRKGWLNRDPSYLHSNFRRIHAADRRGTSYFTDFLMPLFTRLSSEHAPDDPRLGEVPFLNGGLFEEDAGSPGTLRRSHLKVGNEVMASVFEDLLEKYNFVVREDTLLNREVAIDPEMLGKIFESLVLEMETAEGALAPDKRKATGSYYTPRIVVHFICREALRRYLLDRLDGADWEGRLATLLSLEPSEGFDDDDLRALEECVTPKEAEQIQGLLRGMTCCDPAVGSGAFAVGLLHELASLDTLCETRRRGLRDPREGDHLWDYHTKMRFIENSIYGVDIQNEAVEICKLRLWLSLVVDYELDVDPLRCTAAAFADALKRLPALPNLDFKIRTADSLLDRPMGEEMEWHSTSLTGRHRSLMQRLVAAKEQYFTARDVSDKWRRKLDVLAATAALYQAVCEERRRQLATVQQRLGGDTLVRETAQERRTREDKEAEQEHLDILLRRISNFQQKVRGYRQRSKLTEMDWRDLESFFAGSFVWQIDFAEVFARGGFDIIVGNPPFVTARNPVLREKYRNRWPVVCYRKYLLLVPFFQRSFELLGKDGWLGFIVSNAFAKREFGKPLIERFFPTVDLRKVIDCSGLMFPGHGTPTCLVFGKRGLPDAKTPIRVAAILPGGGDLHTPPEDSPLWHTLAREHDRPSYTDERVIVGDRPRVALATHPWSLDASTQPTRSLIEGDHPPLANSLDGSTGVLLYTGADEVYVLCPDVARRARIVANRMRPYATGDSIRDWSCSIEATAIWPYDGPEQAADFERHDNCLRWLTRFKEHLAGRIAFGRTPIERGLEWYEYSIVVWSKNGRLPLIAYPNIATHAHFVVDQQGILFKEKAPVLLLRRESGVADYYAISGMLNSSTVLFWLKQVCFNKGAGETEERDRYEFFGGKVEKLPLPESVLSEGEVRERLTSLSRSCWERGQQMPPLAMRRIFVKPGEGYDDWNRSLRGWVEPHPALGRPFRTADQLQAARTAAREERERLRREMIALQEEMDWLVYAAYGLIAEDHPAVGDATDPEPLPLGCRPFELLRAADGDFAGAANFIPEGWSSARGRLWRARLKAIRDNEHIRRIEQPVYKRRWVPPDYEKEFRAAFDWWLREKAEWWLEHEAGGGPVSLEEWAQALWADGRIRAAAEVVNGGPADLQVFVGMLKAAVNDETVPLGVPAAVPWEELDRRDIKIGAAVRHLRGKLNGPRERFRKEPGRDGRYTWAGRDLFSGG